MILNDFIFSKCDNAEDEVKKEGDGWKSISIESKWTEFSFFTWEEIVQTILKGSKGILKYLIT